MEFQSLLKLQFIYISLNHLTGEIPSFLGNFSALQIVSLSGNHFQGRIPDTLGRLTILKRLIFGSNNLSGTIPPSVFNLSSLFTIDWPQNQIEGDLPSDTGINLPSLQWLNIAENKLTGSLPNSLSNASQLKMLRFSANGFTGKVPSFGRLQSLARLILDRNQLGNGEADDLRFLSSLTNCTELGLLAFAVNNLGGVLPKSIGNFSKLTMFSIGANLISGNIPTEIGELVNLEGLFLVLNQFNGSIPDSLGKLEKLNLLSLSEIKLSGYIPSSLGNLTTLTELYLGSNNLQGSIPSSLAKCHNLLLLDLSQNNLSGQIPKEVLGLSSLSIFLNLSYNHLIGSLPLGPGDLGNLVLLDVSYNILSGKIPRSIGSCTNMRELKIAGNFFHGSIPPSLSSLKSIEILDFSHKKLTKTIPRYLESLLFLQTLDLSFNDFDGEIPLGGVFRNASAVSIVGNSKLCGGVTELQLPKCSITKASRKHGVSYALKLGAPRFSGTLVLILMLFSVFVYKGRRTKKVSCSLPCDSTRDILPKVSYDSLYRATDGFSSANLIGLGKFSSVYKGLLKESETVVAVKVLDLKVQGASKSFATEYEALRLIRHRNLVKVLTTCSSIDFQGNNFKAIVYVYMVHGNLDSWLHKSPKIGSTNEKPWILNLLQRLNIAIDVACALDYLHYHCGAPLVHCDLKTSNVLLDSELVAHVDDFGLAKFLAEATATCAPYQASSIGIIRTIGYAAPEYGMGCEVSTSGDVYSYGILLLEIFTGRRPTDDMFNNSLNLHNFAKMAISGRVMEISDPALFHTEDEEITKSFQTRTQSKYNVIEESLISIFMIGIACSMELPSKRMDIGSATAQLNLVKDILVGIRGYNRKAENKIKGYDL